MSKATSAFSVYKSKGATTGKDLKMSPQKVSVKTKPSATKKLLTVSTSKRVATNKKVEIPYTNGTHTNLFKGNSTKQSSDAKYTKATTKTSSITATRTTAKGSKPNAESKKSTGRPKINVQKNKSMDDEVLLCTSNRKLTKEQRKRKKEVEDFIIRELEKDDNLAEEEEDDEFYEEYTPDENCSEETVSDNSIRSICNTEIPNSDSDLNTTWYSQSSSSPCMSNPLSSSDQESTSQKKMKPRSGSNRSQINKNGKRKNNDSLVGDPFEVSQIKSSKNDSLPQITDDVSIQCNGGNCSTSVFSANIQSTRTSVIRRSLNPVIVESLSPPSNVVTINSITEGLRIFRWLLNPVEVNDFYTKYWERNACMIKRHKLNYFSQLVSFEVIDQMLLNNQVMFTKNIDVTSYKNGVRETLNPYGRALPPVVWEHYGNGCSIRILNPQIFIPALYRLNTTLQEYFHCLVGANIYLTPPNSQGFAPHYDDIEAFVLQIEGRKRWRLYQPRNASEELPRFSSSNFQQSQIGEPILEEVLHPGDLLYFPRGTIHQACTEHGCHSIHITLSVYQKQSFADLFENMMPLILQHAVRENVEMRRGLPLQIWRNAGKAFSTVDSEERQQLVENVSRLLTKSINSIPLSEIIDASVDQVAKKFLREALPPEILPAERKHTIFGSKSTTNENGECLCDYVIGLRTNVRLLRGNIMRLVQEQNSIRLYYYLNNSKQYCEHELDFIEINPNEAGSVEVLIKSYPAYVSVSQLPIEDDERKISLATALWEIGLLMMEKPFYSN